MRNLSKEFIEKQNNGHRNYLKFVDITFADGTELHLDNANLWQNGFSFEESVSGNNSFDIGAATINKFTLVINNIYDEFTEYVFTGAKAVCYIGLEVSSGIEKIRICTGTVSEEPKQKSSIITLSFYDNMTKFDQDYAGVKTVFPATRNQIVRDICSHCDVTLQTVNFENDDYIIQERPTDEALTCRQMLSWVAQIGCQWVKCDEYGRLCLGWYKSISPGNINIDNNGVMSTYEGNKVVHLFTSENGVVIPETGYFKSQTGNLSFISQNDFENRIDKTKNLTVNLDDIAITGVRVTEFIENTSEEKANTYLHGEEGYVLLVSNNKLIRKGTGQTIASMIGEKCVGMRFRPFSTSCLTDIAIEAGDSVLITDKNGISYQSYITSVTLNPGNFESISCNAEPAQRNSAKRYTSLEQTRVELDKNIQKEKTDREQAMEELADRLSNAPGVFTTVQTDIGGGKIFFLHNKHNLSDSDMVWKMTAEAWGVSTDGGKTWNAGMTVDGDTIVRILTAVGVNAEWINAGAITVKDSSGNIIFSVDMDTKKVIISGDSVQIGGKPIQQIMDDNLDEAKNYSDGKLSDYANTVTKDMENLQAQVDGQVEDWYFDYEPSMQNKPASEWTTTAERQKHIGDRFFWKSKGYAYRFMEDNGVWGWTLLQDTDITKAMQTAQNAKDVADGKRRTFITQPVPPYDIGDMWTNGEDILTCSVSRAPGTSYVSSDWEKLNNYTDDTVANQALEEARKAHNLTMSLDNEYQGIPADYNGNIISPFPTVKTGVTVYYGHTDISKNCSYSVQKSASVTGTWDNTNREYTITNLSADTGWVDITATYLGNLTVTKRFNVAKNKGGKPGINGGSGRNNATVYLYQRKSTVPSNPTNALTYTFATGAISGTINNGWSATIPSGTTPLYVIATTASSNTASYTIPASAWSSPVILAQNGENGKPGGNGLNTATVYLYQRNTVVPSKPSAPITYTFSTGAISGLTNGWSKTIPTGTAPLYVVLATASSVLTFDTIATAEWSDPVIMTENGKPGANGSPGRTYFMELSTAVVKQSQDNTIAPNYITMSAFYRDGTNTARTEYAGRFKIEETTDGDTWKTVYTSANNESSVRHSLYSVLSTQSGGEITTATGQRIGISRDVVALRCTLYAAGGTTQMLDMQSVAVVVDIDNLTHEEIFNLLTNNGEIKGIYKEGEQLYISFTYAKGGKLLLGGSNNENGYLRVIDGTGKTICEIDNNGIGILGKLQVSGRDSQNRLKWLILNDGFLGLYDNNKNIYGQIAGKNIENNLFGMKVQVKNSYENIVGNKIVYRALSDGYLAVSAEKRTHNFWGDERHNGNSYFSRIYFGSDDGNDASIEQINFDNKSSINVNGGGYFNGSIGCSGKKYRIVRTINYEDIGMNSYETTSPYFGDIGEGYIDDEGLCYIAIDEIFQETIDTNQEYQVFLQKEGNGDLWVFSKECTYFAIKGTPGLKFSWEIKAKQKEYRWDRTEKIQILKHEKNIDYETQGQKLFENYLLEKENQYEESN